MVDSRWESEYRAQVISETPFLRGEPRDVQLLMYEATHSGNNAQVLRGLLTTMNPDIRTKQGHTALWLAHVEHSDNLPFIVSALEKHYANDPQKLLNALTAAPRANKKNHPRASHDEDYANDFRRNWPAHYALMEAIERTKVKLRDPETFFEVIDRLKRGYRPTERYVQFLQDFLNNGVSADSDGPNRASLLWHMSDCENGQLASQCGRIVLTKLLEEFPPSSKPKELLAALGDINRSGDGKLPAERFKERRIDGLSQDIERAIAEAKQALATQPMLPTTPNQVGRPTSGPKGVDAVKSAKSSQSTKPLVSFTRSGINYDKLMRLQGGQTVLELLAERDELGKVFTPEIWKGRKDEMLMVWHEVPAAHQHQVDIDNLAALIGGSRSEQAKASSQQPREPGF